MNADFAVEKRFAINGYKLNVSMRGCTWSRVTVDS